MSAHITNLLNMLTAFQKLKVSTKAEPEPEVCPDSCIELQCALCSEKALCHHTKQCQLFLAELVTNPYGMLVSSMAGVPETFTCEDCCNKPDPPLDRSKCMFVSVKKTDTLPAPPPPSPQELKAKPDAQEQFSDSDDEIEF